MAIAPGDNLLAVRTRRDAIALPGLVVALSLAVWLQGGFYATQAILIVAALTIAGALAGGRVRVDRSVLAALRLLGGTFLVAVAASPRPSEAIGPMLVLLVATIAYFVAARAVHADGREAVLEALASIAAVAAALGIAGVVFHLPRFAIDASPWRLASSLTYQNAAGALFAISLPAASVLVSRVPSAARRASVVLIASGLALTWSRGAAVAALVAAGVLLASRAVRVRALVQPLAGAALCVASAAPVAAGAAGGMPVAVAGIALGVWLGSSGRAPRRAWPYAGVIAAAAAVLAVAIGATSLGGRFTTSSMGRAEVWSSTVARLDGSILFGSGPGSYGLVSVDGGAATVTRFAHNEYLQAFAETGLVGAAGVLGAFVLVAWALRRARPPAGPARGPWAASVAGCAAFAVQSGSDFLWRFPLLVAIVFALIAVGAYPGPAGSGAVIADEAR